jgi:hypothetical protein
VEAGFVTTRSLVSVASIESVAAARRDPSVAPVVEGEACALRSDAAESRL